MLLSGPHHGHLGGMHFEIMVLQEQGGDVFKGKRHFQRSNYFYV